jgi:hypothetical protein
MSFSLLRFAFNLCGLFLTNNFMLSLTLFLTTLYIYIQKRCHATVITQNVGLVSCTARASACCPATLSNGTRHILYLLEQIHFRSNCTIHMQRVC